MLFKKKIISLVIYIFRCHIRAHTKANEMLYIIYIVVCVFGFSVIQVKASKFTETEHFKRTESQEEIQTAYSCNTNMVLISFCIV